MSRTATSGRVLVVAVAAMAASALTACQSPSPGGRDADVIVVGAGIAGLAAALEAESHGARVLVVEANSMAGGHAVKAGGFALVDTPLQRSKGYRDSPDIAFRDMVAWGEDANREWVRFYADNSRQQVHDWLESMGVKFAVVLDTPEDTVPRFHFTRGAAVNAVVPMIREALQHERIEFLFNTEVTEILRRDGVITGVRTRRTRSGGERLYHAPAVVLSTGGFESNLAMVRKHWTSQLPPPARMLIGSGQFATGSALALTEPIGAALTRMDRQVTFINGLPDPRDPKSDHGLLAQNPAAIWVDSTGRRFTNEAAPSKVTERAVLSLPSATHWLVFDAAGAKRLIIRGAAWLSAGTIRSEILDNPALVHKADDVASLARSAGLPAEALEDTVQRFNRFVDQAMDTDFGRIAPGMTESPPLAIRQPPYYAVQLFPMTRKSMGGLKIDMKARALDGSGAVIRGLFAAGEATGVAGINGSFGGSGTFLGPSVLTGRVAGRSAVALALGETSLQVKTQSPAASDPQATGSGNAATRRKTAPAVNLPALLQARRPGFWHFNVSHALVMERNSECGACHKETWPTGPAISREQRLVQLETCTRCH